MPTHGSVAGLVGRFVGLLVAGLLAVGLLVAGFRVGASEGFTVGLFVGLALLAAGDFVGALEGLLVGLFVVSMGLPVGALEGLAVGLVVELLTSHIKVPPAMNIQESKFSSNTSAIANLILFQPSPGSPLATRFTVRPSASILGYGT